MRESAIQFRFADATCAGLAFETLEELGYTPIYDNGNQLELRVDIKEDLITALEIAEAHGGQLQVKEDVIVVSAMNQAYDSSLILLPAHVVDEEWSDNDRDALKNHVPNHDDLSHREEDAYGWKDEETTNHFPGGIHI